MIRELAECALPRRERSPDFFFEMLESCAFSGQGHFLEAGSL